MGDFSDVEDDDGSHFEPHDQQLLQVISAAQSTIAVWVDGLWKRKRRLLFTSNQRHRVQQFIGIDRDTMYALDINWYILMIQAQFRRTRVRVGTGVIDHKRVSTYQAT